MIVKSGCRAILLLLFCASVPAFQANNEREPNGVTTLPLGVDRDRIRIDATVTNSSGQFAADLHSSDFRVNYLAPGEQLQVRLVSDPEPSDTVFLIDDPAISLPRYVEVQRALRQFIDNDLRFGQRISVIHFGRSSGRAATLTSDKKQLTAEVEEMCWRPARYGADLLAFTVQDILIQLQQHPGRKNLVIFTANRRYLPLNAMQVAADAALRSAATIHVSP